MKLAYLYILIFILFGYGIQADVILLKNGGRLQGIVKENGDQIQITMPYGILMIPRNQIREIILSVTPLDQYRQKLVLIDQQDAGEVYELGVWCRQNGLPQQAKKMFEKTIALSPQHEKARKALGYELYEDRWITQDESMAIKGYVQHKGQWIPPNQYYTIIIEELRKNLEEERISRQSMESNLQLAQQRLILLEEELERLRKYVEDVAKEASKPRYIIYRKYYDDNK